MSCACGMRFVRIGNLINHRETCEVYKSRAAAAADSRAAADSLGAANTNSIEALNSIEAATDRKKSAEGEAAVDVKPADDLETASDHVDSNQSDTEEDTEDDEELPGSAAAAAADRHECIECSKVCSTSAELEAHYGSMHLDNPNNVCHSCQKPFASRHGLQHHIKAVHGKTLTCDICNRQFGYQHKLAAHKKLHLADRAFACTECDRRFKDRAGLTCHMRMHGEKPELCSDCGRRFAHVASLREHKKRVHSTDRPFKCQLCDKAFVQ